ncbi:MAG TPA: tetratricopeptide repeat protein [Actinomycetota bacterium]
MTDESLPPTPDHSLDPASPPAPPMPPHRYVFGEEPDTEAEIAAERADEAVTSRSEALVAILIVFATLAAAVVGFLQIWASGRSDAAAASAQRDAIAATAQQVRSDRWSELQVSTLETSTLDGQQADLRDSQAQVLGQPETPAEQLLGVRLRKLSDRYAALSTTIGNEFTHISIAGRLSPAQDPSFPTRFVNQNDRQPIRLHALQDAANTESSGWSAHAATYTAVLTLFAVALYLLGFSLALPAGLGRWFVRGGVAFLVIGVAWAAIGSTGQPEAPSETAAAAFADGTVDLQNATDAYDSSGYRDAVAHLNRAIEERPDFARAYLNRGQATYFASSPTQGLGTVTSPEALRSAIADLKHAVDLGLDNAEALGDIGAMSYQQALVDNRPDLLNQALDFTKRVIAIDPQRPLWLYNLGVTELALGRRDQAMATFRSADTAAKKDLSTAAFWVTGAMSALDVLAEHRPSAADDVLAAKQFVVGDLFGTATGAPAPPSDLRLQLVVTPSLVQFAIPKADAASIDPTRDVVVAQWYYDDPDDHGFAVLPEVSGRVALNTAADGGWFNVLQYLPTPAPPRCLPTGTYRVEVYVNGHLAGTASTPENFGSLRTVIDEGLNAGFCIPTGWIQNPVSKAGVTQAWHTPDASEGIAVIRATVPGDQTSVNVPKILDIGVRKFAAAFLPPLRGPSAPQHFLFMGLTHQLEQSYRYQGGVIQAGAGYDPGEGAVIVAIAFGHTDRVNVIEQAFQSLSSLQQVPQD